MDRRPEYQVHRIDLSQASPAGGLTIDGQFGVFRFFRAEDAVAAEVADALVSINVQGTATGDEFPLKVGDAIFCPNVRRIRLIWAAQASVKWAYFLSSAGREEMEIDARPKLQLVTGEIDIALAMVDTLAARTFHGGEIRAAVAAEYQHVQLHNPVGSGKVVYLTGLRLNMAATRYSFRRYDTALGTLGTNAVNKTLGGAAPAAQIRTSSGGALLGTRIHELRPMDNETAHFNWRSDPFVIGAGEGVLIGPEGVTTAIHVAYDWLERDV